MLLIGSIGAIVVTIATLGLPVVSVTTASIPGEAVVANGFRFYSSLEPEGLQ